MKKKYVQILIELMAVVEDSTVVHRHSIGVLEKVQQQAKYLLSIGGITTTIGKKYINELEKKYINEGISSGGCADLLAVTIFLEYIEKEWL